MICAEPNRLLENCAATLRVLVDTATKWRMYSESKNTEGSQRIHSILEEARIESDLARTEMDRHVREHGCRTPPI
jgi:hypothetical protein